VDPIPFSADVAATSVFWYMKLQPPDEARHDVLLSFIAPQTGKTYRIPGRHQTIVQMGIGLRRSHVRSAMILASCT
jgi:hypothetical protein